jgi:hypothetical protein
MKDTYCKTGIIDHEIKDLKPRKYGNRDTKLQITIMCSLTQEEIHTA